MANANPVKQKKKPQRTCVVCKTTRDKKDLIRVVLQADGTIKYDPTGKASGRGSYLCKNEECIKQEIAKSGKLAKGLRHNVSREEIEALAQEILKTSEAEDTKEG